MLSKPPCKELGIKGLSMSGSNFQIEDFCSTNISDKHTNCSYKKCVDVVYVTVPLLDRESQ